MPITILQPRPVPQPRPPVALADSSDSDSDGGADIQGDVSMRGAAPKKPRRASLDDDDDEAHEILTPGSVITSNPQWMRGHGTYVPPNSSSITSSLAGILTRTNKLLSVRPLRARYTPEIGDLVVGRIAEVQARRWRVDVAAAQLAVLQISAVNLPGGILRKRTETDELQIRSFFAEGDLVVAEVQQLHQDGAASLHTRSLRYGKLRNGLFVCVSGTGGGGGVVRSKRQVWTADAANGAGKIDVLLGVNGYIWVSKHVEPDAAAATAADASPGINRLEESVSSRAYSSQNDHIDVATMREIARFRSVILALVENGLRVDEHTVTRAYDEAVEMGRESVHDDLYLGGEKGQRLAAILSAY
ncbi:exosome complex component rrp4 [Hirsutella rhossiliensis]|uniref:Exosome complex component rrp4 n=1 Tax=Hirsutella rhossiliensis TaxID=111463 RepID=A0A9P8MPX7_9HYPO|nr:exosome complex component rrp4 [Hirsutella rhossiliensis]KAH0958349.1 exosome complex component rrp4 [Hirsutella rhossiliensis]